MKKLIVYIVYLLLFWGAFRYFFDFADAIEELWIKPVIWLVPLFWWNISLKKRVSFFEGSLLQSVFVGLITGIFYWIVIRGFRLEGAVELEVFGVALATAVVEELAFSGFVLGYLQNMKMKTNMAVFLTSLLVAFMRLPILLFGYETNVTSTVFVLIFVFAVALINGMIRAKTKNVIGSVVARTILNISLIFN